MGDISIKQLEEKLSKVIKSVDAALKIVQTKADDTKSEKLIHRDLELVVDKLYDVLYQVNVTKKDLREMSLENAKNKIEEIEERRKGSEDK